MSDEKWYGELPENLATAADKFENLGAMVQSYAEMESYKGNSIRIPSENAGESDINDFREKLGRVPGVVLFNEEDPSDVYNKLGRPEDPTGYEWEKPEGYDNPEADAAFFARAHELGMTKKQAAEARRAAVDAERAAWDSFDNKFVDKLEAWKKSDASAEETIAYAGKALMAVEQRFPGFMEVVNFERGGNHPAMIQFLAEYAKSLSDDSLRGVGEPAGGLLPPGEAQEQYSELLGAIMKGEKPDNDHNKLQMQNLLRQTRGLKPVKTLEEAYAGEAA